MTRILHRLLPLAAFVLVVACTTEQAAQNVYEGIQSRDQGLKTPADKAASPPPPSYPDYEAERKRLRGNVED